MRGPFLSCSLVAFAASSAGAATWNVPGDAPTITSAVSLAAAGDTVLVECGTYPEHDISLTRAVTIRSRTGSADCVTIDAQSLGRVFVSDDPGGDARIEGITVTGGSAPGADLETGWGGGMLFVGASPVLVDCHLVDNVATVGGGLALTGHGTPALIGCVISDNSAESGGGVACFVTTASLTGCTLSGNAADSLGGGVLATLAAVSIGASTFHGNGAPAGGALHGDLATTFTVDNTILASGAAGQAVQADSTTTAVLTCCNVWGHPGGDWTGALAGQLGVSGNIAVDPLFCDPGAGDLSLQAGSPCLPGNHPDGAACGLIGAHGACGAVAAEPAAGAIGAALRVWPNPGRTSIRLAYEGGAGPVRLTILDVRGRRVRSFTPGTPSGLVLWNGTDQTGRAAAAGTYFVRLEAEATVITKRALLLR
jgi:hypothetical protein